MCTADIYMYVENGKPVAEPGPWTFDTQIFATFLHLGVKH